MRQKKDLGLARKVTKRYNSSNSAEDAAEKLYLDFSDMNNTLESFKKYAREKGYEIVEDDNPRNFLYVSAEKEKQIIIKTPKFGKEFNFFLAIIPYCSGYHYNKKKIIANIRISIGFPILSVEEKFDRPLWWTSSVNAAFSEYLETKYPEVSRGSHSKSPIDVEALDTIFKFIETKNQKFVNESTNLGLNSKIKEKHSSKTIEDETETVGGEFFTVEDAIEFIKYYAGSVGWSIDCYSINNFAFFNQFPKRSSFILYSGTWFSGKRCDVCDFLLKISDTARYDSKIKDTYMSMRFYDAGGHIKAYDTSSLGGLWNEVQEKDFKMMSPRDVVNLFAEAENKIKATNINEHNNLGLSSKVKKTYKDEGIDRVYNEFNEESIKEIFNKNLTYALYGTNSPKSIGSGINMFGYHCDKEDGVDNPDLNWLYGCMLYTINYKNLYIHSTILATEDVGEFMGIYIKWITVDHLGHGEFLILPEDIEDQELRKDIEEGIVID